MTSASTRSVLTRDQSTPNTGVRWAVAITAAIMALVATPSARAAAPPPNIVLVVIDTLRADHLGCYGYGRDTAPHIDALAKRGVLFERCYSTSSWTLPATASLLSGVYPARHGAQTWTSRIRGDVPWLVSRLQEAGYHTMGVTANPFLTAKYGFDRGFDIFDDQTVIASAQWSFPLLKSEHKAMVLASTSATTTRRAMELLNQAQGPVDAKSPGEESKGTRDDSGTNPGGTSEGGDSGGGGGGFFLLVHYMDVHADYVPPPPLDTKFDPDYDGSITGHVQSENIPTDISDRDLKHVTSLYDGEIARVDRSVGRLMDQLSALGIRDQTAVIVTADHGEELLDHGGWSHGHTLYQEVVRVPLIVDWPGKSEAGRRVATPVSLVDVMPTVLKLAGIQVPSAAEGRSLAGAMSGQSLKTVPLLMQTRLSGRLSAAVLGRHKIIARVGAQAVSERPAAAEGPALDSVQRFDLTSDPDERHPEAEPGGKKPQMVDCLTRLFRREQPPKRAASGDVAVPGGGDDSGRLEQLRQLGYVGGGSSGEEQEQGDKP